jgi:putative tricarboxylic transport membrane protein
LTDPTPHPGDDPAPAPRRADLPGALGSGLMMGIGALAVWHARDFSDLGAVFPRAIGGLLVALGALYLLLTALGRTQRAAAPGGSHARRAGVAVVMLAWAFGLPVLGFLASSAAAMLLLLLLAQHERWTPARALLYPGAALAVLGALYALFKIALQVPLP